MLVAGLSTGHVVGLAVVAAIFIAFALISSFVMPRRHPDFPGRAGLSVFVIASFVLFGAMLTAVEVFGRESEPAKAGNEQAVGTKTTPVGTVFQVQEKEFRIVLPAAARKTLQPGTYAFAVHNGGKLAHDLAVQAKSSGKVAKTKLIQPGGDATLTVTLTKGLYDVFCTVPGHRQAGMEARLTVS